MDISQLGKPTDVGPNEFPFYVVDPVKPPEEDSKIKLKNLPQGPGSGLDANSVMGLQAYTTPVAGALLALRMDGTFAPEVYTGVLMPDSAIAMVCDIGTYAELKARQVATKYFGFATDIKQFMLYTNDATVGDGGWVIVAG